MQVLEDESDRGAVAHPLEEEAPGGEEVGSLDLRSLAEAEQVAQERLDPLALAVVGDVLLHRRGELRQRARLRLVLGDPGPHPHHLGERPEGDALAVGQAATPVPPDLLDEPVEVLLELPGEP